MCVCVCVCVCVCDDSPRIKLPLSSPGTYRDGPMFRRIFYAEMLGFFHMRIKMWVEW